MKNLSKKQLKKVAEWYGVREGEVSGYCRMENGHPFDLFIHFSDGSMAWIDASCGRGLYLVKVGF